ncbi:MAG: 4Fe-4S dicluster domain-containing protein [Candidatus Lokiarchaeota archaeon]|nr:4Fe-4S dicluster domain-containing protein [Candidatus Lokiarchaeota archaeon]
MSDDDSAYRELQQHLDELPIGFPATKSGVELRLLKHFFTPEEARIATKLSRHFEPLSKIHNKVKELGISLDELEKHLDNMVSKGGIDIDKRGNEKLYANSVLAVGMFEHKVNQLSKEFLDDFFGYSIEGFGMEFLSTQIAQLRIIPIEESISPEHHVIQYDQLEKLIKESDGPFGLQDCICRKMKGFYNIPCKVTSRIETCISTGTEARMYIDQGWAREVSKEEVLEVLRQNEADGLVLQPGNFLNPNFICSCCGCCCGILSVIMKSLSNPVDFIATNYYAVIEPEACTGCGTCLDRCQMNALTLKNDVPTVNLKRCLGCGLCVPTCPADAIKLVKKDEVTHPFQTKDELHDKILEKKTELRKIQEEKMEQKRRRKEARAKQSIK